MVGASERIDLIGREPLELVRRGAPPCAAAATTPPPSAVTSRIHSRPGSAPSSRSLAAAGVRVDPRRSSARAPSARATDPGRARDEKGSTGASPAQCAPRPRAGRSAGRARSLRCTATWGADPVPDRTAKKRRLGAVALVEAGGEHRVVGADAAVGDREERVVDALEQRVVLLGLERPERVAVEPRRLAEQSALELVVEHRGERPRSAAEEDHVLGDAGRLCADRDDRSAFCFGHEQERVTARQAAERPELVAGDEDDTGTDPAAAELVEQPARRVGLVGQADLDVLGVARDSRVEQTRVTPAARARPPRRSRGGRQPRHGPAPRRGLADLSLGRIRPLGLGDQVDLPAVQTLRNDLCVEAALGKPRNGDLGGDIEASILGRRRVLRDKP